MARIPGWVVEEIASELIGSGDVSQRVATAAARYHVHPSTIYRRLQQQAGRRPQLEVSDGERRAVQMVAYYIRHTMSEKTGRAISTATAIRELEHAGRLPAGTCHRTRVDQVMRFLGIHKRNMRRARPCVRLASSGPNAWHQADFTVSKMFYLENLGNEPGTRTKRTEGTKGTIGLDRELAKRQKTKVLIGIVKDHFSGAFFARGYAVEGESAEVCTRLLYDAWSSKSSTGFPFHGLPRNLYTDAGPGFKAKPVQSLLAGLGVKWQSHLPGNPRATGSAESAVNDVGQFEALARGRVKQGWRPTIEQFNQLLMEYCIDAGNRRHVRFARHTRLAMWDTIPSQELRACPDWDTFVGLTAIGEEERRVTPYGTISVDGEEYYVGTDLVGQKVQPYRNATGGISVRTERGTLDTQPGCPVVELGGEVRAPALTDWERELREMHEVGEAERVVGAPLERYERETDQIYLPREGMSEESSRVQGLKGSRADADFLSEEEALFWIAEQTGQRIGDLPESTRGLIATILGAAPIARAKARQVVRVLAEAEVEVY